MRGKKRGIVIANMHKLARKVDIDASWAEYKNRSLFNLRRNSQQCLVTTCVTTTRNTQLEMTICGYFTIVDHISIATYTHTHTHINAI